MDALNLESMDRRIGVLLRGVICGYRHGATAMKQRGGGSIVCPGFIATQVLSRAFGISREEAEPFRAFVADRAAPGQRIP